MIIPGRLEFIDDIPFVVNSIQTRPSKGGVLETDRDLCGLLLEVEGRDAIAVAAMASENADSPYSIVDEVRVHGISKIRKKEEWFYVLRGPDIREKALLETGRAPFSTGAIGVAIGSKDFRFHLPLCFWPQGDDIPVLVKSQYVLPCRDFDSLVCEVKWADGISFGPNGAGTTHTFTAFGSAAGSPRARIHGIYAQWGSEGRTFQPGQIWRSYKDNASADLAVNQTDYRLLNLLTGNLLRSLLIKTGTLAAVTAGNRAYATRINTILGRIALNIGTNKIAMSASDFLTLQEYAAGMTRVAADAGFGLYDFCGEGDLSTAYPEPANADADFFLKADVVGAASQAATVIFEEIRVPPTGAA
jgi:hypothetical protein